jgi:hypothetical protein
VHPTVAAQAADRGPGLWARTFLRPDGLPTGPVVTNIRVAGSPRDRAGGWLRIAMLALAVLAAAAAVVSYEAQYRMVYAYKASKVIAALQAGIPDAAALVFAALGIAMALNGKRAVRARLLNVVSVGTSVYMNLLAAGHGWKALSVWALAPIAYAITSDTLIGVLRSYTLARLKAQDDDEATPMAMLGKAVLYSLRFVLSPGSTVKGLKQALMNATPLPGSPPTETAEVVEAGEKAAIEAPASGPKSARPRSAKQVRKSGARRGRDGSKTAQFLTLVAENIGPFTDIPLGDVYRISAELAPKVNLDPGSARTALRRALLAAQEGGENS